ncbi:MAG: hypothetical protein IPH10_10505 [bacterium]|nr:hypothetical protein [bacterium]
MKKHFKVVVLAVAVASIATIVGCSQTSEQKLADAKAEVVDLKKDVKVAVAEQTEAAKQVEWLSFKSNAEVKIMANDKAIADYKARMSGANGKRRAEYDKKIDALELKNKELKARLVNYPETGKSSWEQFKNEFSHDMDELGSALKDFAVNNEK